MNIQDGILRRGMWQLPAGIYVVIEWSLQSRCLVSSLTPVIPFFVNSLLITLLCFKIWPTSILLIYFLPSSSPSPDLLNLQLINQFLPPSEQPFSLTYPCPLSFGYTRFFLNQSTLSLSHCSHSHPQPLAHCSFTWKPLPILVNSCYFPR